MSDNIYILVNNDSPYAHNREYWVRPSLQGILDIYMDSLYWMPYQCEVHIGVCKWGEKYRKISNDLTFETSWKNNNYDNDNEYDGCDEKFKEIIDHIKLLMKKYTPLKSGKYEEIYNCESCDIFYNYELSECYNCKKECKNIDI